MQGVLQTTSRGEFLASQLLLFTGMGSFDSARLSLRERLAPLRMTVILDLGGTDIALTAT